MQEPEGRKVPISPATLGRKPAADTARGGKHRKTNSEIVRNPPDPAKQDDKKRPSLVRHKNKGSLEDYIVKKAQYKLLRAKKEPSSASYGGYGKLFCSGESHGSGGSFGRPFATTVDVHTIVRKVSSKNPAAQAAVGITATTVPARTAVSPVDLIPGQTNQAGKEGRHTTVRTNVHDEQLYSINEDNTHVSVISDCTDGSNVTTVHVGTGRGEEDSSRVSEPEELNTTTRLEENKDVSCVGGIYSLKGRTFCASYNPGLAECSQPSGLRSTGESMVVRHTMASSCHSSAFLSEKCVLRAHMDGVRDVQFSSVLNYMMTVSEDCMVKLWDIKNLKKNAGLHPGKIEPYFTYRGHTGTLFACCVGSGLQQEDHFLYSAGSEGIIRIWSIPTLETVKYPSTNGKNYCVGLWTSHRDVICQLVHHPSEPLLLSVSSDGTVKMWKEFDINEYTDSVDKSMHPKSELVDSNDCLMGAFVYKSSNKQCYEIPTSAAWTRSSHNSLLISYVSPMLGLFDRVTVLTSRSHIDVGKGEGHREIRNVAAPEACRTADQ